MPLLDIVGPCNLSQAERRDLEKKLTGKIPYSLSPIQYQKGEQHTMSNGGGTGVTSLNIRFYAGF
jgi:hypothetical protein